MTDKQDDNNKYAKISFDTAYKEIKGRLRFHAGNREIERLTDRTTLIELFFFDEDDDDWSKFHLGVREAFADWIVNEWDRRVDELEKNRGIGVCL